MMTSTICHVNAMRKVGRKYIWCSGDNHVKIPITVGICSTVPEYLIPYHLFSFIVHVDKMAIVTTDVDLVSRPHVRMPLLPNEQRNPFVKGLHTNIYAQLVLVMGRRHQ